MPSPSSQSSQQPPNPYSSARWTGSFPGETEEQAQLRLRMLEEAQKTSKEIDDILLETKKLLEKKKKAVKILLLGQSESGKSSVLKNFQLAFAQKRFDAERSAWKTIVQLNLIISVKTILEVLTDEWESAGDSSPTSANAPLAASIRNFRRTRLGLSPLFIIQTNLMKLLCPENKEIRDVCVRAGSGWKSLLQNSRRERSRSQDGESSHRRSRTMMPNSELDPTTMLSRQKEEIIALWEDSAVQEVLQRRGVRLEQTAGFFLNDVSRIATLDYEPTDLDIIRARIRTVGIEEHHFVLEKGTGTHPEFYITDVGGTRSQRASWVPYFDDVQAILFLAPLAFNQTLEEDPRVNRLEDSLSLWREICSSKLLANASLILFFNKKDVLSETLAASVYVKRYVPSYGDQPNDIQHVTKYFRDKFRVYHKKYSTVPRPFMCYETSAIDINSMTVLLVGVRESILRQHLRNGDMI